MQIKHSQPHQRTNSSVASFTHCANPEHRQEKLNRKQKQPALMLPKEHGAVIIFFLSCLLAARLGQFSAPVIAAICCLSTVLLSAHRPAQALGLGLISAAILMSLGFPQSAGVLALFAAGTYVISRGHRLNNILRQTLAISALAAAPLLCASAATSFDRSTMTSMYMYCGASLAATALVQSLLISARSQALWAGSLSLLCFSALGAINWLPVAACIAVFATQAVWFAKARPGLKQAGIVESFVLLAVVISLMVSTP